MVNDAGNIAFTGSAQIPVKVDLFGLKISVTKSIDIRSGFFNNSGLLGNAARGLRDAPQKTEDALRCAETGEGC